ncbi:MAG: hypothetical protein HQM00_15345, partial [Magnetococcales bacterium]|nr:hypothetical protein [Magnetococcales bacterium]
KDDQREQWPTLLLHFDQALVPLMEAISRLESPIGEESLPPPTLDQPVTPPDPESIGPLLRQLARLLSTSSGEALDTFELLKERMSETPPEISLLVQAMERDLDQFDFDRARTSLHLLASRIGVEMPPPEPVAPHG